MSVEDLLAIRSVILLLGLAGLGVEDLRTKQVSSLPILVLAVIGCVLSVISGDWGSWNVLLRFLPGGAMLLLAWMTKESIGYGDAWILLCMGCFMTEIQMMNLCVIALSLSGLFALFLLLVRRKSRKTQIPFVPFLLAGYGIILLI